MSLKPVIGIIAIIAILTIFSSYVYGVLAENDNQIDVEGTDYEDTYESNAAVQTATSSILGPLSLVFGAIMLILAFGYMRKKTY